MLITAQPALAPQGGFLPYSGMRTPARTANMTPTQFRKAIERLGLSQEMAGEFFGQSKRQGQRWANGEAPIPLAVGWCLEFMLRHGVAPADLRRDWEK